MVKISSTSTKIKIILGAVMVILAVIFTVLYTRTCNTTDDDCKQKQKKYEICMIVFWVLVGVLYWYSENLKEKQYKAWLAQLPESERPETSLRAQQRRLAAKKIYEEHDF